MRGPSPFHVYAASLQGCARTGRCRPCRRPTVPCQRGLSDTVCMGLRGICEALARLSGSVKRRRWQRILCATMAGVLACLAAPSSGRAGGCMAFGGRCVPCGKGAIVTVGRRGRRGGLRLGRGPCLRCLVKAGSTADCIGSHSPAVTQPAISLVLRVEKPGTGTRFRAICLNMLQGVGKSGAGGSLSDPAWIARFCMGKTCCDLVTLSAFARIDFPRRSKAAQRPDCPSDRSLVRSSGCPIVLLSE